ncbi:hypothetical protein SASPL_122135 [Salvia splendens]|uniref:PARP1-like PADR1 domain-containing protein n=1 Tax=Salvia splendens TaxID=180675 RepID=A0A8X8ZS61_SALSN|nr:hypothetical protein SASPL_122135 [Salvia splendens]
MEQAEDVEMEESKNNKGEENENEKSTEEIIAEFENICKAMSEHLSLRQMREILEANGEVNDAVVPGCQDVLFCGTSDNCPACGGTLKMLIWQTLSRTLMLLVEGATFLIVSPAAERERLSSGDLVLVFCFKSIVPRQDFMDRGIHLKRCKSYFSNSCFIIRNQDDGVVGISDFTFALILLLVGVASLGEVVTELTGAPEAHGFITNLIGAFIRAGKEEMRTGRVRAFYLKVSITTARSSTMCSYKAHSGYEGRGTDIEYDTASHWLLPESE